MTSNPLIRLTELGQSVWLDAISRRLIASGGLRRLIREDGLRGMTSNPALFAKAIEASTDYDEELHALSLEGKGPEEIYEAVTLRDVTSASDEFRHLYHESEEREGYVSVELDPRLARDAEGSVAEARRLWRALNRPNVMVKVPATAEGLGVIEQLLAEGINVNVTLLFGLGRYRQAAEAALAGLEARAAQGKPVNLVASVASFFLSRIDSRVDPVLERIAERGGEDGALARRLKGEAAVATAKAAYRLYREIFGGERFRRLAGKGARPQRLLWASTGTKDPGYSDVKYVDSLIGPETVATVPPETLDAYRDHGDPAPRLESGLEGAYRVLEGLARLGVDLEDAARRLEDEGVAKFVQPYEELLRRLESRRPLRAG